MHHKEEVPSRRELLTICSAPFTNMLLGASLFDLTSIEDPKEYKNLPPLTSRNQNISF